MRWIVLLALLVTACAKGAEADLPAISQARSLGAEWALINEQASEGQLTTTYVQAMRKSLHQQLETCATSLTQPRSAYGEEIAALLREPDGAAPQQLREHASKLKRQEDALESA